MTCPCLYPLRITLIDEDGDKNVYWAMPEDEIEDDGAFKIPKIENVVENDISYKAVMWKDPKDASVNSYEINDHLVYAGCSYDELVEKKGKMKCIEKAIYIVLHPADEWERIHEKEYRI